jgi:hypothetical protein
LSAPLRLVTVYEPVLADLRHPGHFRRHHGPPIDPDSYLLQIEREVEGRGVTGASLTAIADPVSVADGLADHLAALPARMLVLGQRRHRGDRGSNVIRHLLERVSAPMLVVSR